MSFSREVKQELIQSDWEVSCKKATISAIIKMNSTLGISSTGLSINISFENVTIIKNTYEILKELYDIESQIVVSKQMKLKKKNVYTLKITDKALEILGDLKLMKDMEFLDDIDEIYYRDNEVRKAYIVGSFIAAGTVNSPTNSNYHLEIQSNNEKHLQNLKKMIDYVNKGKYPLDINFKMIKRRNNYVLYLKSSREILDFLKYMGAIKNTINFLDVTTQRDFINSINRMNNMDVANEQKAQAAAQKQIELINVINETMGLDKLEPKLREIARLRLTNPEASLVELCNIYNENHRDSITKSGMNHRFRKIREIASKIKIRGE